MLQPMMLWVTRSAPYDLLTAHRLRGIGHMAFAVPVLKVCRAPNQVARLDPQVLVFTSAHGVEFHPFDPGWLGLPVYTVGDHTAEAARRAGYRNVRSARGDVSDVQKLIVTTVPRPSCVIHFSAAEAAGDLAGYLRRSGYEASRQVVYEADPVGDAGLEPAIDALSMIDGIVIHSPKAARRVAEIVARSRWYGVVFCLSQACAAELRELPGVLIEVAPRPTEESLMSVLRFYRGLSAPDAESHPERGTTGRFPVIRSGANVPVISFANDNSGETTEARRHPQARIFDDPDDDPPPGAA